jgi:hypothetical protein
VGDAFVLRNVLHDWSDEDSLTILKVMSSPPEWGGGGREGVEVM